MNYKFLFPLLYVLFFNSCLKEYKVEEKTYHYLRCVLVAGNRPIFAFSENNLRSVEKYVNPTDYRLEIIASNGQSEVAINGDFKSLIIEEGLEYTIVCTFNNKTYKLKKSVPSLKNSSYDIALAKADQNLVINTSNNKNKFFLLPDGGNINYNSARQSLRNSINSLGIFPLFSDEGIIQIYPPINYDWVLNSGLDFCFKPFDYLNYRTLKPVFFTPWECSLDDYEFVIAQGHNWADKEEPLQIPLGVKFDIKSDDFYAKTFAFLPHDSIGFEKYLTRTNPVTYHVTNNDPSKYQVGGLSYEIVNDPKADYNRNYSAASDSLLFFNEWLRAKRNYWLGLSCHDNTLPNELIINLQLGFTDKQTKERIGKYLNNIVYSDTLKHIEFVIP